jgi:hypothetical protein
MFSGGTNGGILSGGRLPKGGGRNPMLEVSPILRGGMLNEGKPGGREGGGVVGAV